jgi:endogenous inhibitor of DNA gyrase (YacG/DUF329 family)
MKSGTLNEVCIMCGKPADWIRSTQFAGDHPFCEQHAKKEDDFGVNDSYEYWYNIEDKEK